MAAVKTYKQFDIEDKSRARFKDTVVIPENEAKKRRATRVMMSRAKDTVKFPDLQSSGSPQPVKDKIKVKSYIRDGKRVKSSTRKNDRTKNFISNHKRAITIGASSLAGLAGLGFVAKKGSKALKNRKKPAGKFMIDATSPNIKPVVYTPSPKLGTKITREATEIATGYKGLTKAEKSRKVKKRQAFLQREMDLDIRENNRPKKKIRKERDYKIGEKSKNFSPLPTTKNKLDQGSIDSYLVTKKAQKHNKRLTKKRKKAAARAKAKYENYTRYVI